MKHRTVVAMVMYVTSTYIWGGKKLYTLYFSVSNSISFPLLSIITFQVEQVIIIPSNTTITRRKVRKEVVENGVMMMTVVVVAKSAQVGREKRKKDEREDCILSSFTPSFPHPLCIQNYGYLSNNNRKRENVPTRVRKGKKVRMLSWLSSSNSFLSLSIKVLSILVFPSTSHHHFLLSPSSFISLLLFFPFPRLINQ